MSEVTDMVESIAATQQALATAQTYPRDLTPAEIAALQERLGDAGVVHGGVAHETYVEVRMTPIKPVRFLRLALPPNELRPSTPLLGEDGALLVEPVPA